MISKRLPRPSTSASGRGSLGKSLEEGAGARERVLDAGEAGGRHRRGGQRVARRHAAEVEGLLDVLGVAHPVGEARGLLHRVGELKAQRAGVEAEQRAGGRRGAEQAAQAVGAVRAAVGGAEAERDHEARADVVAERHGAQQARAVAAGELGRGEGCRHHRAAGMEAARGVGIVALVGMRADAVGERRVERAGQQAAAGHGRLAPAALAAHPGERPAAGQQARARDHRGQRVEQVLPGLLGHVLGQGLRQRARDVLAERARDRRDPVCRRRGICHSSPPVALEADPLMPPAAG